MGKSYRLGSGLNLALTVSFTAFAIECAAQNTIEVMPVQCEIFEQNRANWFELWDGDFTTVRGVSSDEFLSNAYRAAEISVTTSDPLFYLVMAAMTLREERYIDALLYSQVAYMYAVENDHCGFLQRSAVALSYIQIDAATQLASSQRGGQNLAIITQNEFAGFSSGIGFSSYDLETELLEIFQE